MSQWTDESVQSSLGPGFPSSESATGDASGLPRTVSAFWDVYAEEFTTWWSSSMSAAERRRLLRVVAPNMPMAADKPFSTTGEVRTIDASLCPELNLDDLSRNPAAVPQLYASRTLPPGDYAAFWDMQSQDLEHIRQARELGRLHPRPPGWRGSKGNLYVRDWTRQRVLVVKRGLEQASIDQCPALASLRDVFVSADLWEAREQRQALIYQVLALLADEYRTEVAGGAGDTTAYAVSAPLWAPAGVDLSLVNTEELEALWAQESTRLARLSHVARLSEVRRATLDASDTSTVVHRVYKPVALNSDGSYDEAVLLDPAAAKAEGNALFGAGRYRAAAVAYTDGIDELQARGAANARLPAAAVALLATLLSNRSACYMRLAADGRADASALAAVTAAAADCEEVLESPLLLPMEGTDIGRAVPEALRDKVRRRAEAAATAAATLRQQLREAARQHPLAAIAAAEGSFLPPSVTAQPGARGRRGALADSGR